MAAVAVFYQLPPWALPAIHRVEGGRPGVVRHNSNGTDDLGTMQVNTLWLPALARGTGMPEGRLYRTLVRDACFNVAVAGAILRIYLHESGDPVKAIGFYHSHTPAIGQAYRLRVLAVLPPRSRGK
jgi:hypothetical protein